MGNSIKRASVKRARGNVASSNQRDSRLFAHHLGRDCAERILRVENNHPRVTNLNLCGRPLNEAVLRRLGDIVGRNSQLKMLTLRDCTADVTGLCAGLQHNKCIADLRFYRVNLSDARTMASLAPFLTNNPSLREISLRDCAIGPAAMNILSNALSGRTEGTLCRVSLEGNPLGGSELNGLVGALRLNRELTSLDLRSCRIGPRGCSSLATMLEDQQSNLCYFDLLDNPIDDEGVVILAASLSKNTRLKTLDLFGFRKMTVTARGCQVLLNLVCERTSTESVMASNHTVQSFGQLSSHLSRYFLGVIVGALGAWDACLLRASLELNKTSDKVFVVRRKVLWSHFLGALNIGDSVVVGKIPPILSCFGDSSDETIRSLVEYHRPHLPEQELATMRLDSVYRIILSTADQLCCQTHPNHPNEQVD